jgi:hypothetical protein
LDPGNSECQTERSGTSQDRRSRAGAAALLPGVCRAAGQVAGEYLARQAPRLSGPEAHVVELLAATPPAPAPAAVRHALALRRQILARRRLRAVRPALSPAHPRCSGGRRERRADKEQGEQGCGSGPGHGRMWKLAPGVRGKSRMRRPRGNCAWRDEKKLSGEAVPAAGFTKRGLLASWPGPQVIQHHACFPGWPPTSDRKGKKR